MKAFQRDGKIILCNEERKEVETLIVGISKEFEKLKSCCEDRSLETFPVDVVRKIVEKGNQVKELGEKVEINEKYIEYLVENKEALEFFQRQISGFNEQINNFTLKIDILKRFANRIEKEVLNEK